MSTHWIPAARALALVAGSAKEVYAATYTLCARAHHGLVQTKAAQLIVDGKRRHVEVFVPPGFWWAEGRDALKQNWATGDFGTWINREVEWRAFGVEFALDGLLGMVPAERRASLARGQSVAGDAAWASARESLEIVLARGGLDREAACRALISHGQLGFITARAVLMQRIEDHLLESTSAREWDVPPWFWSNFARTDADVQRWDEGKFEGEGESPTGRCSIALTGLFISRDGLDAAFPASREPPKVTERQTAGGRPRADYWDDLWCAISGSIYRGEMQPKTQADLERWMLQWASDNGHDPGVTTIRLRARKLFRALTEEDQNSRPA